jgi:Putative Ig domain
VHDNLFDDVTAETWGTGSRPIQLGAGPDAITIDHNTFITTDTTIVYFYGGAAGSPTPITNTSFTNNMSRHNSYGINGSNYSPGMPAILAYMPDGVVTRNVLAGGSASKYPAGNLCPTAAQWQAEFVGYAAGDFRLAATSPYKAAGTDGADLGADIDAVLTHVRGALAGDVTDSPSPGPPGSPVPPLTVATATLADGTVGQAYTTALLASGGIGSQHWLLASGALPAGVILDGSGRIDGVPTGAGTFAFTVQVVDSQQPPNAADRRLSITIVPSSVVISTTSVPTGIVGLEYRASLTATGGSGTYAWSVIAGGLPPGLFLTETGLLSGIPTTPGSVDVTVAAADTALRQNAATRSLSIAITAPALTIDMPAPSLGIVGQPYQLTASASGQIGTVTWSIASGALPPGIALNASTGVISGAPTGAGTFTAMVRAQDVGTVTRTCAAPATIVVNPKVAIVTSALPAGNVGSPYSASLVAAGSIGTVAWSVIGGALPAGLTLDAGGIIRGAPTALGSSTFTVRAVDSAAPANDAARSFTVAIGAREIVLYVSAAKIVGSAWSRVSDATAADGARVWNPDRGASRVKTASASPSSYVELTFQVEAGVPYHLWLRASAERNSVWNDSVHVQFSSSVDANGSGIYRIGTKQSAAVVLEDGSGAGVSGWGWQDDRYGAGALGPPIYFQQSGPQTIRLQQREDGISIDQLVLSAGTYVSSAPGAVRNDTVILAR